MTDHHDKNARAWELIEKLRVAFFVTSVSSGMRGRPLSAIAKQDEDRIYFLIDLKQGSKDEELEADANVFLGFGDGASKYVAVTGTGVVSQDGALVKRLWNPGAQAFWPNGPTTPGLAAIIVTPHSAEYWDGPSTLVSTAKFAFALATGSTPDLGANEKVAM